MSTENSPAADLCPHIGPTSARPHSITRSPVKELGTDRLHLSLDQLCFLAAGLNSCMVTNPATGKRTHDSVTLWQVHELPTDDYAGWRSVAAKFNADAPDWRDRAYALAGVQG